MANEIQLSARVQVSKNGASFAAAGQINLTQTGNVVVNQVQLIGNPLEALDLGDIAGTEDLGYVYLQNLNAPGGFSISFYLDGDVTKNFALLNAGEFMLYRPFPNNTFSIWANSGGEGHTDSRLLVLLIEA